MTAKDIFHCQVCGNTPAIRSHLIPQAFVREINQFKKSNEKHMLVHNEKGVKHPSTTGRFEQNLLCASCDGVLGTYEASALTLLRRLRRVEIGHRSKTQANINAGIYAFRVLEVNEFLRFACGILWKYASIDRGNPSFIDIGKFRLICEDICFRKFGIPESVDVFIEKDLFSYLAYEDPYDVYYYSTPSTGVRSGKYTAWFSVGAFTIYIKMDDGVSSFAPRRCWMRGKKRCYLNVDMRSFHTNVGMAESIGLVKDDLDRLNKKLQLRA